MDRKNMRRITPVGLQRQQDPDFDDGHIMGVEVRGKNDYLYNLPDSPYDDRNDVWIRRMRRIEKQAGEAAHIRQVNEIARRVLSEMVKDFPGAAQARADRKDAVMWQIATVFLGFQWEWFFSVLRDNGWEFTQVLQLADNRQPEKKVLRFAIAPGTGGTSRKPIGVVLTALRNAFGSRVEIRYGKLRQSDGANYEYPMLYVTGL